MRRLALLSVLLIGLVAAGLAGVWAWMRTHPIDVSALAPRLEAEAAAAVPGLRLRLGQLSAIRDPLLGTLTITARNVRLSHPRLDGPAVAGTVALAVNQSVLMGTPPRLRSVVIDDVLVRLPWHWADLVAALDDGGPPGAPRLPWRDGLHRLAATNVTVLLPEQERGTDHRLVIDTMALASQPLRREHIEGAVSLQLTGQGQSVPLDLTVEGTANGAWTARLRAQPVTLQRLPELVPWLSGLPRVSSRADLTATLEAGPTLAVQAALSLGPGVIDPAAGLQAPVALRAATARARWSDAGQQLELEDVSVLLAGSRLTLAGRWGTDATGARTLRGGFDQLTIPQLIALWPEGAAPGGRSWIAANITTGQVRDGRFTLAQASAGARARVDLRFGFRDLTVHYRRPMPPLLGGRGTGRLTEQGLILDVAGGRIAGLRATPATVRIEPFGAGTTTALIAMNLEGSLTSLLQVLDSPPLGFISRYGRNPATISGQARGQLNLTIPLLKSISLDDVQFSARAQARQARIPEVYGPRALSRADLDLTILPEGLVARGRAVLGAQPVTLQWREDFTGRSAAPTRYDIRATTSVDELVPLGLDLTSIADGGVSVAVQLEGRGGDVTAGGFQADLAGTRLTLPLYGVVKVPRAPGTARGTLRIANGMVLLDELVVRSGGINGEGWVRAPIAEGRSRIGISRLAIGSTLYAGTLDFGAGQPVIIDITSPSVDLRAPLTAFWQRDSAAASGPAPVPDGAGGQDGPAVPVVVSARIGQVQLLGDVAAREVSANATVTGEALTRLALTAQLGETGQPTRLDVLPAAGSRRLSLETADAGALGRGLDLFRSGQGGALDVEATLSGSGPALQISGRAQMRDFRVTSVPALAQALTLASLTGLRDTMSGRGIEFRTVDVPFTLKSGVVDVRNASAIGPGLGLTLEGQVDRASARTNLRGVIVPSYTLNAAIGRIPLVGRLIVGGRNQGLIGFNYRVEGTLSQPKVTVNTASGLAPGFLRRLFSGPAAVVEPSAPAPAGTAP